jgi:hypothetical protein
MRTDSQPDRTLREGGELVRLRGLQGVPPVVISGAEQSRDQELQFALEWQVADRRTQAS